jgi:hypothetical protein
MQEEGKYPKGHWMGVGIAIGIGFGIPMGVLFGVVMDSIALGISLGPAIGVGIGCAIGAALEAKHRDEIRPLTEGEKKTRRILIAIAIVLLLAGVLLFFHRLLNR